MNFSSLRQWVTRSAALKATALPEPREPIGAEAQFQRGLDFASGTGVAQDYAQAAKWYELAAEQNHILAQLNLATLYGQGHGVARDQTKSLMWLTRAAKLGNAAAQYKLGIHQHLASRMARAGSAAEGRIEALKWVRLSAGQNYRHANNACEFVALGMTRDEVTESVRRMAAFVPG
jgi:TPR repeat protein